MHTVINSMGGNWKLDVKNGTLKLCEQIGKMPGPIGQAVDAYSGIVQEKISDSLNGECTH